MANKAIIGVERRGRIFAGLKEWAKKVDRGQPVTEADYYLNFETAAMLFSELTPQRMKTLEILKQSGPQTIYALAKKLGRNYSNVHQDISKLVEHGLVDKNKENKVFVPWSAVEIHVALGEEKVA